MISVVIPVFGSAPIVGETIDRVLSVCEHLGEPSEVIAVDDASRDGSLAVLRARAARHSRLRVVALPVNVGQQAALLAGLRQARGAIVVCMDDDLQHPPEAIPHLLAKVREGHDVVFARFAAVRRDWGRQAGSLLMRLVDRLVFGAPRGLAVTSFRALRRDVVDLICAYRGASPYIRGQALRAARRPANVDVVHAERPGGGSSYSAAALVTVVARVLLEWSTIPAWSVVGLGLGVVALAWSLFRHDAMILGGLLLVQGSVLVGLGVRGLASHAHEGGAAGVEAGGDAAQAVGLDVDQSEARVVGGTVRREAGAAGAQAAADGGEALRTER